jgi:hypothetical protein
MDILKKHDFTEATEGTVDKSSLPAVLQVRDFGKRGRSKYTCVPRAQHVANSVADPLTATSPTRTRRARRTAIRASAPRAPERAAAVAERAAAAGKAASPVAGHTSSATVPGSAAAAAGAAQTQPRAPMAHRAPLPRASGALHLCRAAMAAAQSAARSARRAGNAMGAKRCRAGTAEGSGNANASGKGSGIGIGDARQCYLCTSH